MERIESITEMELNNFLLANAENSIKETGILNFDDALRQALYFDYLNSHPQAKITQVYNINTNNLKYLNEKASISNNPVATELPYGIYFGEAIFENIFDIEQTFSTPSFSQTVTNTFTSEVKWGINNKTEVKVPFVETEFSFTYNETNSETKSTSISLTSPSQTINVPGNTTYKVTIYLAASEGYVNIDLKQDISGSLTATITDQYGSYNYETTVSKAFQSMAKFQSLPRGISVKDDNTIHFSGLGTISSFASQTNYNVMIDNITNQ